MMWVSAPHECPHAEHTSIALEYGAVPMVDVLDGLRGDHRLHLHPEAPQELASEIRRNAGRVLHRH